MRYVLEGSVQRDQNRVRVNAQLIDAETGAHLWADRFEEDVADLFKLQDQVVARLGNALGFELVKAEAAKERPLKQPGRHRSGHARLGHDVAILPAASEGEARQPLCRARPVRSGAQGRPE